MYLEDKSVMYLEDKNANMGNNTGDMNNRIAYNTNPNMANPVKVVRVEDAPDVIVKEKKGYGLQAVMALLAVLILLGAGGIGGYLIHQNLYKKAIKKNNKNDSAVENTLPDNELPSNDNGILDINLGGSFVDDHNQELFISGLEQVEIHDQGNVVVEPTKPAGNKKPNNTPVPTAVVTEVPVVTDTPVPTGINAGGDVIINDNTTNININVNGDNNNIGVNVSQDNGYVSEAPATVIPTQVPQRTGYVMRKVNYVSDGRYYSFYEENGQIYVDSHDTSEFNVDSVSSSNSNILAISSSDSCSGWVLVRQADNNDLITLDSVENYDALFVEMIREQQKVLGLK